MAMFHGKKEIVSPLYFGQYSNKKGATIIDGAPGHYCSLCQQAQYFSRLSNSFDLFSIPRATTSS